MHHFFRGKQFNAVYVLSVQLWRILCRGKFLLTVLLNLTIGVSKVGQIKSFEFFGIGIEGIWQSIEVVDVLILVCYSDCLSSVRMLFLINTLSSGLYMCAFAGSDNVRVFCGVALVVLSVFDYAETYV